MQAGSRLSRKNAGASINEYIINLVKNKKPQKVSDLVKLVQEKHTLSEIEITKIVIRLQNEGRIRLIEKETPAPQTLGKYLHSSKAAWYWTTISLAAATTLIVFTVPEDAYPTVYLRNVLGIVFVLWLPGYAFVKALFPIQLPIKTSSENLDLIERVALSIGMSIALVPIIGLILNYTQWGIRLTPITLSLLALTIVCATAAIIREQKLAHAS